MTNTLITNEVKPYIIVLNFDESELTDIVISDEYDFTPKDLTINFDLNWIDKVRKMSKFDPDFNSIDYQTEIISESFEGKLQDPLIQIFNFKHDFFVNANFCNGNTGTTYELDITNKVTDWLSDNKLIELLNDDNHEAGA